MLTVSLCDANLSGSIEFEVDSLADLRFHVERAGTWQKLPGVAGDVLLSEPYGYVYQGNPFNSSGYLHPDAFPAYRFETSPRGTVTIGAAE